MDQAILALVASFFFVSFLPAYDCHQPWLFLFFGTSFGL
jgi:hypothetical protein